MKSIIFAVILLICGISSVGDPDAANGSIVCIVVGIAIIAYKIVIKIFRDEEPTSHSSQQQPALTHRSSYQQPAPTYLSPIADEPLQREKNLIPEGYLTDIRGELIPLDSLHCPFTVQGLMRIDSNFYEITSPENIQFVREMILSLNRCLDEAAALRSDLPSHRFSSSQLNFKFNPYAYTRNYCMISFRRFIFKGSDHFECTLHINYTDALSGEIVYDADGNFQSAKVLSRRFTQRNYSREIVCSVNCYNVEIIPSESGVPILKSVKTTDEIERERQRKSDAWQTVHQKWQAVTDEHARLLNEIGVAYAVASNLNLPDSPQMQHVVELCRKDIALADKLIQAQIEIQNVRVANEWSDQKELSEILPSFPTFKRLAIIYEKQKKYDEAIAVCQRAVELGFIKDGTNGQMPGRIARLLRKKNNELKKIKPVEDIIIEDKDEFQEF